jgi:hypothetical protein
MMLPMMKRLAKPLALGLQRLVALQPEIRESQFRLEFRFVGTEGFTRRDAFAKPIPALERTGDGDLHRVRDHR